MEDKIKQLENKLKEKDATINNLVQKVNLLEENMKEMSKLLNYNMFTIYLGSSIIQNNEFTLVEQGIKDNFNKKIQKCELLLRGSRDGFGAKEFHSKCDGQNFTVVLIQTTKGRKFGGFTEETWDQSESFKNGPKSFIFSIDQKEIYYYKEGGSIYCHKLEQDPQVILSFGEGKDFKLFDKCNETDNNYERAGKTFETNEKAHPLVGEYNFRVEDYEVYKIYLE
jgi:hypothetical protein